MNDRMTVGRMKSILAKYDNDFIIYVYGGENEDGEFGVLRVAKNKESYNDFNGEIILRYEY